MKDVGVHLTEREELPPTLFERGSRKLLQMLSYQKSVPEQAKLQQYFKNLAPDLVAISQSYISDGLVAAEAARDAGLPYVVIMQVNSESWWPTDELAERMIAAYAPAQKNYFVAEANRSLFCRQLGYEFKNSCVVSNPSHLTVMYPIEWPNQLETELSLACVARLEPVSKGQDLILEVLAQPKWRDRSVSLHLYGKGMCGRSLKRQVNILGLEDKVHFAGHVDNISDLWSRHHALILPSRYEGTPLSLIEAMRCGRPAICTGVEGIPELLEDGKTGFLVPAPTITHVDEALERAWQNRQKLQSMGEAASKAVAVKLPADPIKTFADELIHLAASI